ncbi:MAG: NAD(P)H-dependent glycerol-3-phosphate dehydrogenase [Pseudomonadota bacterium]
MSASKIGVVGAGAWGTALAQTMARAGHEVTLWAHETETVSAINTHHENKTFLAGVPLETSICATTDYNDLKDSAAVLLVPPAQHMRAIAANLNEIINHRVDMVICAKGIERETGALMVDVVRDVLPDHTPLVLSGPSFAADVARGRPAALTLACADDIRGRTCARNLGYRDFRLYWTDDLVGVQLGGAVKNVLAIAAGIVAGKSLGASAHAALVTRGFAELQRLGVALGARPETLMGLSGLGDLILTCGSTQSRNMSLGRALGEGKTLQDILGARASVTEGVFTTDAVVAIADQRGVEMPIARAVQAILNGKLVVDDAIDGLLSRPMKPELAVASD